jgi:hypothetical protein
VVSHAGRPPGRCKLGSAPAGDPALPGRGACWTNGDPARARSADCYTRFTDADGSLFPRRWQTRPSLVLATHRLDRVAARCLGSPGICDASRLLQQRRRHG